MDIEEQYDKIYRFCYYRVRNKEIAEDLTQETFLRFMNSRYEERGEVTRYLYTIARNLCIEESRHIKTEELPVSISDGGTIVEGMMDKILVEGALGKMAVEDRELLILRYLNEESVTDICEITGISRFALYRRLNRAKKEFIKMMEGGKTHEQQN